jgi:hypothetical protein
MVEEAGQVLEAHILTSLVASGQLYIHEACYWISNAYKSGQFIISYALEIPNNYGQISRHFVRNTYGVMRCGSADMGSL